MEKFLQKPGRFNVKFVAEVGPEPVVTASPNPGYDMHYYKWPFKHVGVVPERLGEEEDGLWHGFRVLAAVVLVVQ